MEITAANLDLLFRDVSQNFQSALTKTPVIYPEISTTLPMGTREMTQAFIDRIPQMRKWLGPRVINNIIARSRTILAEPYEDTVSLPRYDVEDDLVGLFMSGTIPMVGEAGAKWPDGLIAQYIISQAASVNGYDGVPNYSAAHPILAGVDGIAPVGAPATQSNFLASTALTWDNVAKAISVMESWVGVDGAPMGTTPNVLMVPPQLRTRAEQIIMTQWRSGIESNVAAPQENTLKSRGIKVLVNPWLRSLADDSGTNGMWFLLDTSRGIKPFAFYQRQPVKMTALVAPTDPNVFMNNQFIWGIDSRGAASETVWWLSLAATSAASYGAF